MPKIAYVQPAMKPAAVSTLPEGDGAVVGENVLVLDHVFRRAFVLFVAWALFFAAPLAHAGHGLRDDAVAGAAQAVILGSPERAGEALDFLRQRGNQDVVAGLILALQFSNHDEAPVLAALKDLTGHQADGWFQWMLWQEANGTLRPHPSFAALMVDTLQRIDPKFAVFFRPGWQNGASMRVRMEEIVWGGVGAMTGIPSLDYPHMIKAAAANYLAGDDLVFGVEIAGDARAYPLRIMGWHEMFNDSIGGVPVALAYCTLCGSGILYETLLPDRTRPLVFGSSGLLYRSNKLMFDWETLSLWNQFTGEPVAGPLAKSGIRLKTRPVAITTWAFWRQRHPDTTVLALDTGHSRDYGSDVVYKDYFAAPNLMFPAVAKANSPLKLKDYIFGIRAFGAARAWPLAAFAKSPVINDSMGERNLVLIGNAATRTVRAYERGKQNFQAHDETGKVQGPGGTWTVMETALVGPKGEKLVRVAGHIAYWFAWENYMSANATLYAAAP
ncbi:MAG: DUF3179 domain-containing protein [Proteobacteria bacterium]|nr:DUF3179 domain-containing protein [Pseudomonadota bacterium]